MIVVELTEMEMLPDSLPGIATKNASIHMTTL